MAMDAMTEEELAAANGLSAGNLEPLADLLEGDDTDRLHPIVKRRLFMLLRGPATQTDFRLSAEKHPDLPHLSQGIGAKRRAAAKELRIAKVMWKHWPKSETGDLLEGGYEAALTATLADPVVSEKRATVAKYWGNKKKFLLFCRAHGMNI